MLLFLGSMLVIFAQTEQYLALFLALFLCADISIWVNWLRWTRNVVESSRQVYTTRNDFSGVERLNVVERHICGWWHIWRFILAAILVSALNVFCFDDSVRLWVDNWVHVRFPEELATAINGQLPGLFILIFVIINESWCWTARITTHLTLLAIDALAENYRLVPK